VIENPEQQQHFPAVTDAHIIKTVQQAISQQQIVIAPPVPVNRIFAGGTNMCPNSDLAWSEMAATLPGITPATVGATNLEVHRVSRQVVEANISSQLLRTAEGSAWIPLWDRVQGVAEIGATAGNDNYDIAFRLNNNWLVGNRKWYIRVAVALDGTDPIPEGLKLFAGFWVKRTASEGWATGGTFSISKTVHGVPGTAEYNYKVIAKADSGFSLESQVLNVTDAPDTLDSENYVRITYPAASGFIEFEVYREDVATGVITQIARDRNSSQLVAYDTGQPGTVFGSFPAVITDRFRAYADVYIDAVDIAEAKTFHNLTILVPPNFDTTDLVSEGTYLRIGLDGPTTNNRQVLIDTIWASETFNTWSPSAFDSYPSPPSTSMVTSPPTTGGGTGNPPNTGGGYTCVWTEHDLRLAGRGWVKIGDAEKRISVENGTAEGSILEDFIDGEISQAVLVEFDCGLKIFSSGSHRYIRSFTDYAGINVHALNVGDTVQGGYLRTKKTLTITKISIVTLDTPIKVRGAKVMDGNASKFYAVGDETTGWYVYCHNAKSAES
jgi:hypothetical protein